MDIVILFILVMQRYASSSEEKFNIVQPKLLWLWYSLSYFFDLDI